MAVHPLITELAQRRRRVGWSQPWVANQLGVGEETVQRWETGHRTPPFASIEAYAALFGLVLVFRQESDDVTTSLKERGDE